MTISTHSAFEALMKQTRSHSGEIVHIASGASVAYRELDARVEHIAQTMRAQGIDHSRTVLLGGGDELKQLLSTLALIRLRAGIVFLPPACSADALDSLIARTSASAQVNDDQIQALTPCASPLAGYLVFMSSGTTGAPKLILHRPDALLGNAQAIQQDLALSASDRILSTKSIHHAAAFASSYFLALAADVPLYLPSDKRNPKQFVRELIDSGTTYLDVVNSLWKMLTPFLRLSGGHALKQITLNGEAATLSDLDAYKKQFPGLTIRYSYGLSEAGVRVSMRRAGLDDTPDLNVGVALISTQIRIEPIPDWQALEHADGVGQIMVRGPSVMAGYWTDSLDCSAIEDGWLKTKDLGYIDAEGRLFVCGRVDDAILRGGELIYPQDVEAVLLALPGVTGCAVFATETGSFRQLICVYESQAAIEAETLRQYVKASLPSHCLPNQFVSVRTLPLTAAGKKSRSHVRRLYEQRQLDTTAEPRIPQTAF